MKFRLTRFAQDDITAILRNTRKHFGHEQLISYANTIDRGIGMIAEHPQRAASLERNDIGQGVRSFHFELATGRRRGASHILYYRCATAPQGEQIVLVLRILHESMEPKRRLTAALRVSEENDDR